MWSNLVTDATYRALARGIWLKMMASLPPPDPAAPEELLTMFAGDLATATAAVATLRARGVKVVLVSLPSIGPFYAPEDIMLPRAQNERAHVITPVTNAHIVSRLL